ncbi:transposase [Thermodesulfovibrio thiophilus]|uniref:transposase n=1 Tax=Thermodesulfovibrio thiophilus TaxID=340095 RepID=UPI0004036AD1|nr:transposase [Thermodesulfovibrio thiophilus]
MIKRRVYTKEFKIEAVEHTLDSTKTVKEISEDLGVPYHLLCKWRSKYLQEGTNSFPGHGNLKESEKELKNVTEERDILKKALAIFSQNPRRNIIS